MWYVSGMNEPRNIWLQTDPAAPPRELRVIQIGRNEHQWSADPLHPEPLVEPRGQVVLEGDSISFGHTRYGLAHFTSWRGPDGKMANQTRYLTLRGRMLAWLDKLTGHGA